MVENCDKLITTNFTSEDLLNKQVKPPRILSNEEIMKLEKQNGKMVSDFRKKELENEAKKFWDLFYKRNRNNFFKDRHWTFREFEELSIEYSKNDQMTLLEAGCGVGNAIFPILKEQENLFVYACDFSPRAVKLLKENSSYSENRCFAFQFDLASQLLTDVINENSLDFVSLLFVLSSIDPSKFEFVLRNIYKILKPGGMLLFRDYGLHDWAMIRFKPGCKISENFYVRQDGTRAYYFEKEAMKNHVVSCGFGIVSNDYVLRETVNKKEGIKVPRVFLQGKYIKKTS